MKKAINLIMLGVALTASMPVWAAPFKSYDFDGDLTDTFGNGLDLTSFGGNLATFGRYTFGPNQGLSLAAALPSTTNYTIEIKFQVVTPSLDREWNKLIDYENTFDDDGLYFHRPTGVRGPFAIQFYPDVNDGPDAIPLHTDVVVKLTRNSSTNTVVGYLNDVQQWSFDDTLNRAVPSNNLLTFFIDDLTTEQGESFGGSVDYIRIGIPEPASSALLSSISLTFIATRVWRR